MQTKDIEHLASLLVVISAILIALNVYPLCVILSVLTNTVYVWWYIRIKAISQIISSLLLTIIHLAGILHFFKII